MAQHRRTLVLDTGADPVVLPPVPDAPTVSAAEDNSRLLAEHQRRARMLEAAIGQGLPSPGTLIERLAHIHGITLTDDEIPVVLAIRQQLCSQFIAKRKSPPADMAPLVAAAWRAMQEAPEGATVRLGSMIDPEALSRSLGQTVSLPPPPSHFARALQALLPDEYRSRFFGDPP